MADPSGPSRHRTISDLGVGQERTATSATESLQTFRRQRAARACETCNRRKVRCDAVQLGIPCTNCVAFQQECKIPDQRRKRKDAKWTNLVGDAQIKQQSMTVSKINGRAATMTNETHELDLSIPTINLSTQGILKATKPTEGMKNDIYVGFLSSNNKEENIHEPGDIVYLSESSNLTMLVNDVDRTEHNQVFHFPAPGRVKNIDPEELEYLKRRGAFLLPSKPVADHLVATFFSNVAPLLPVIDRTRFMKQYTDPNKSCSVLLLQAIFLAASRSSEHQALCDNSGTTNATSTAFYKRARALYDASFEPNRIINVQALVLMNWYWEEGGENAIRDVYHWSGIAVRLAQVIGMHRNTENSKLSISDKKLWKRIWWTLFTRDRMIAAALGRPFMINTNDTDVQMLTEDDFIEGDAHDSTHIPHRVDHALFFLNLVKLCEIMGIVLTEQYAPKSRERNRQIDLIHSDMAMASWMMTLPDEMRYNPQESARHKCLPAILHSFYYTTLCMLHRAYMGEILQVQNPYPSRNIAFTASAMISRIVENLKAHNELRVMPAFSVHTIFCAIVMLIYQLKSASGSGLELAQQNMDRCMSALAEISKHWTIGRMVYRLLDAVRSSPILVARMEKALNKGKQSHKELLNKRKFNEMVGSAKGSIISFERTGSMPTSPNTLLDQPSVEDYITARKSMRTLSPFNTTISGPTSPPQDLYLVTRSEPPIEECLLESFQSTHLFPEDFGVYQQIQQQDTLCNDFGLVPSSISASAPQWHSAVDTSWDQDGSSSTVSNGSRGTGLPQSFNVEDWYDFFGMDIQLKA